jgi:hypothetical protein
MKHTDALSGLKYQDDFIQHLQRSHRVSRKDARELLASWMRDFMVAEASTRQVQPPDQLAAEDQYELAAE